MYDRNLSEKVEFWRTTAITKYRKALAVEATGRIVSQVEALMSEAEMSEAEIPNNHNESLFESNPAQDAPHPAEHQESIEASADWVTVHFPDAIGADDVPRDPEPSQTGLRIQELEHHNHRLRSRVAELESALISAQTQLKTETKRLETIAIEQRAEAQQRADRDAQLAKQQAAMIAKQRQALDVAKQRLKDQDAELTQQAEELAATQAQVMQLTQELDLAHQATQKQHILAETLTEQLQCSQERVAQLERECALIKQRHDQQLQLVRQTEDSCRDLRSRLQRQQQYTLQFKSALEKCLDVPAAQVSMAAETAQRAVDEAEHRNRVTTQCFVKAQPVQPWSATPGLPAIAPEPEVSPAPVWEPEPVVEEVAAEPQENILIEATSEEEVLPEVVEMDLSVEHEIAPESIAPKPILSYTIKRSRPEEAPATNEANREIDLFQPTSVDALDLSLDTVEPESVETEENFVTEVLTEPEITVLPPEEETSAIAIREEGSIEDLGRFAGNPWEKALLGYEAEVFQAEQEVEVKSETVEEETVEEETFAAAIQPNSPFITLTPGATRRDEPLGSEEMVMAEGNSPSPVVYPERSKKLPSLAAVELPSFPRASK